MKTTIASLVVACALTFLLQSCVVKRVKFHWVYRDETKLTQQWSYVHSEGKIASWYGSFHHGRTMANGRKYNMYGISVAHKELKLGTLVKVTNLKNGLSVYAKVTDRGPYIKGRVVDVSYGAAKALKMVKSGIVPCRVEVIRGLGGH